MIPEEKEQLIRKIVIERIKSMAPNVKIALGSKDGFLGKSELIEEINNNTPLGKKIIDIQFRYLKALQEGLI